MKERYIEIMITVECAEVFLLNQEKLCGQRVVDTLEEAAEFLEENMAYVCRDIKELREYMEENMDITGLSDQELIQELEVFPLKGHGYLVVEV